MLSASECATRGVCSVCNVTVKDIDYFWSGGEGEDVTITPGTLLVLVRTVVHSVDGVLIMLPVVEMALKATACEVPERPWPPRGVGLIDAAAVVGHRDASGIPPGGESSAGRR
jgi:hypothetical protein